MRQQKTWISRCIVSRTDEMGGLGYYQLDIATDDVEQIQHHNRLHELIAKEQYFLTSIEWSQQFEPNDKEVSYQQLQFAEQARSNRFSQTALDPVNLLEHSVAEDRTHYLIISPTTVEPTVESNKPFWAHPWIDEELKKLLFKSDTNTFLLVDSTARAKVSMTFDLDHYDDIEQQCLYSGDLAVKFKKNAPYLLNLTLTQEQLEDDDKVSDFHKDFFTRHWGQNTGLLLQSKSDINTLARHFKKFIKIQNEQKKWFFFRFCDPRIMNHYLGSITQWPQRVAKWFGVNGEEQLIDAVFCEDSQGGVVKRFEPNRQHQLSNAGVMNLTASDYEIFSHYRRQYNKNLVINELSNDFPAEVNQLHSEQLGIWYEEGIKKGNTTARGLYDYCYAQLMAKNYQLDLAEIEQYLEEQPFSHLEKSNILQRSIKQTIDTMSLK